MIKIWGKSICKPLQLIFGSFQLEWKKVNVVPVHTKGNKQCLKNYRLVSLLPICGRILERLIFNEMFRFLIENNLISSNQSGFMPGGSCINQLLHIIHEYIKIIIQSLCMTVLKWEVFFLISQKHLLKFDTRLLSSN